jgi:short-subunit dehydrogenase
MTHALLKGLYESAITLNKQREQMTVLITGASGGLGRAFALECASRGWDLLLTDINEDGLEKVRKGILRQYAVNIHTFVCDIRDDCEVDKLIQYAENTGLYLDMLFNVAGIDHEGGFTGRSFDKISEILRLNIEATLRVTYKALKIRRRAGRFYIIFVSSLASLYPMPLKAAYAASKRFLLDFSYALGQELKAEEVSVLSLCPAGLMTTQEALHGIAAQGFWGRVTTNRLEKVAGKTINKVMKGRKLYIPGGLNRAFSIAAKIVPAGVLASILYNRWSKAQKRRPAADFI